MRGLVYRSVRGGDERREGEDPGTCFSRGILSLTHTRGISALLLPPEYDGQLDGSGADSQSHADGVPRREDNREKNFKRS